MAIRMIRTDTDPILRKISKPVPVINDRVKELIEDMIDTLKTKDGVGLSAPQVGILKRIAIVDFGDEEEYQDIFGEGPIVAVNPEIIEEEGEITRREACLSFPEQFGEVSRPERVKVKYQNIDGEEVIEEYTDMVARCFCHEIDHLNGIVFIDKVIEGTLNKYDNDES